MSLSETEAVLQSDCSWADVFHLFKIFCENSVVWE